MEVKMNRALAEQTKLFPVAGTSIVSGENNIPGVFNTRTGLLNQIKRFGTGRIDEERLTWRDPYLEMYRINRIF